MRILIIGVLLCAQWVFAGNGMTSKSVEIGKTLPVVELNGRAGELRIVNNEIEYMPWSSSSLRGQAHLLYIVAARLGVDKINDALLSSLRSEGGVEAFPDNRVKVISVINIDDVFPIARTAFEDAKLDPSNSHAMFVLDDKSLIHETWGLKPKGAAVIVLDTAGRVRRFKDGKLSSAEIDDFISVIKKLRDGEPVE